MFAIDNGRKSFAPPINSFLSIYSLFIFPFIPSLFPLFSLSVQRKGTSQNILFPMSKIQTNLWQRKKIIMYSFYKINDNLNYKGKSLIRKRGVKNLFYDKWQVNLTCQWIERKCQKCRGGCWKLCPCFARMFLSQAVETKTNTYKVKNLQRLSMLPNRTMTQWKGHNQKNRNIKLVENKAKRQTLQLGYTVQSISFI